MYMNFYRFFPVAEELHVFTFNGTTLGSMSKFHIPNARNIFPKRGGRGSNLQNHIFLISFLKMIANKVIFYAINSLFFPLT